VPDGFVGCCDERPCRCRSADVGTLEGTTQTEGDDGKAAERDDGTPSQAWCEDHEQHSEGHELQPRPDLGKHTMRHPALDLAHVARQRRKPIGVGADGVLDGRSMIALSWTTQTVDSEDIVENGKADAGTDLPRHSSFRP
jgi:hypothetical protein